MNNNITTGCSDTRLRALLQSDEHDGEFRSAAEHVESCATCHARLEELAAGRDEWIEAKQLLAADPSESQIEREEEERSWSAFSHRRPSRAWTESMTQQVLAPPSHPEMLGRLGRYEVERLMGAGGMGVVFKAFDSELNRPVAVKVLAPYLAGSGAARQRFAREARAAAAVVDEHVVAIHNVETDGESPFLVMQYVAGESLQSRLDRCGPLDVCEILRIAMQTAKGLAAAHAQGLIHRDVKPSNIMLEESVDRALLTDFGLARAGDDASLTHTGYHPGTPQYMSSEQARGDAVDQRSDLFSLGSVMYTMCTGRPPFRAETSYGILRRITDTEPRPVREINPDIPDWLCSIIAKLMAKEPEERFDSAAEVAELLEDCLAHVQQPTTTPLPAILAGACNERSSTSLSRTRLGVLALVAVAVLVVGAISFVQFSDDRDSQVNPPTESNAEALATVTEKAVVAEPDFEKLVVTIEPFGLSAFAQQETLKIEADGRCWYTVAERKARANVTARSGAVFRHELSNSRVRRLNRLLEATKWLQAEGAEGRPTRTHPTTIKPTLDRGGKQTSVTCVGDRPEPYRSLQHELLSIAYQERRIYLHDYLDRSTDTAGIAAWQEIGREVAALLRGEAEGRSPYTIEYDRYVPIARRILGDFQRYDDDELIPAVRIVSYFKVETELESLHRLAHDRSTNLTRDVAAALGRIHDSRSLPVLVSMMEQRHSRDTGYELIKWGEDAIGEIVKLIERSTSDKVDSKQRTVGEDMVRSYLEHWDDLQHPIDARVVTAVEVALRNADPRNSIIRTKYHEEFLMGVADRAKARRLGETSLHIRRAWFEPATGHVVAETALPGSDRLLYVELESIATRADVASARVIDDPNGKPAIEVTFKDEAAQRLREATAGHAGNPLAIFVDSKLLCAPKLQERFGERAIITGDFRRQYAEGIAQALNVGAQEGVEPRTLDIEKIRARQKEFPVGDPRRHASVEVVFDKEQYFLGENVLLHYRVSNNGEEPFTITTGGDSATEARRPLRFKVFAMRGDGTLVRDPYPQAGCMGGPLMSQEIKPGQSFRLSLPLMRYCDFETGGKFRVFVYHDLGWDVYDQGLPNELPQGEYLAPVVETQIDLVMPNAEQARQVIERAIQLPRDPDYPFLTNAHDYADFTTLRYPVYLPILKELTQQGDERGLLATTAIGEIATPEATSALIELLEHPNPVVAADAQQKLLYRVPHPQAAERRDWSSAWARKYRFSKHAWKDEHRAQAMELSWKLLEAEDRESLLAGANVLFCLGEKEEFPRLLKIIDRVLTDLALDDREQLVHWRADTASGSVIEAGWQLVERGAESPLEPETPGELALFMRAIGGGDEFRPSDWEQVAVKAMRHPIPFVRAETIANLPKPLPESLYAALLPRLQDDAPPVQAAALNAAAASAAPDFLETVLRVRQNPADETVREAANRAMRACRGDQPQNSDVEEGAAWGEPLRGLRMRLSAPDGNEYRLRKNLPLLIEMQNVSDEPIKLSDLHSHCEYKVFTEAGEWLGIARKDVGISPWEGANGELAPQQVLKWQVWFDQLWLNKPVAVGSTVQVRVSVPRQIEEEGKLPRTSYSEPVMIKLIDAPSVALKQGRNRPRLTAEDVSDRWTEDMEIVYREEGGLFLRSLAIQIDGQGNVTMLACGGTKGRIETKLSCERLDKLAARLHEMKIWKLSDVAWRLANSDEGEVPISLRYDNAWHVGDYANGLVDTDETLSAFKVEMLAVIDEAGESCRSR